jgi:hypothetical protein
MRQPTIAPQPWQPPAAPGYGGLGYWPAQPMYRDQHGQALDGGISAAIAAGALGYTIIKDALTNNGDISYQLSRLAGIYFPGKDTNATRWQRYAGVEPYRRFTRPVEWWVENWIGDRIAARFDIDWWGNGHAMGPVRMSLASLNDAVGWGLVVETDIIATPSLFGPRGGPYTVAAVDVRLTYRFNRSIGSDVNRRIDLRLFGDGDHSYSSARL